MLALVGPPTPAAIGPSLLRTADSRACVDAMTTSAGALPLPTRSLHTATPRWNRWDPGTSSTRDISHGGWRPVRASLEVTTTCQLHMRSFEDGDEIVIEPWRADPFPVIKDLVVDRRAFDRIIASGG